MSGRLIKRTLRHRDNFAGDSRLTGPEDRTMSDSYEFATHNLSADIMGWPVAKIGDRWRPSVSFPRTWHAYGAVGKDVARGLSLLVSRLSTTCTSPPLTGKCTQHSTHSRPAPLRALAYAAS